MRLDPEDRVLCRIPAWLGDAVMALPAVDALADFLAPGNLTLAGPARLVDLVAVRRPEVRTLPLERGVPVADTARAWRGHDVAVLLTGSFRSAWTAWRAGIPERVGWARDGRGPLLTTCARPSLERGRTPLGIGRPGKRPRYLPRPFGATATELLGWIGVPVRDPRPRLSSTDAAHERVDRRLIRLGIEAERPFVALSCGSRPGSAKGVPVEVWADAAALVGSVTGLELVAVGGPGEESLVREVVVRAGRRGARSCSLIDPVLDLEDLVRLFERATVVLCADSGPRHLAAAAGARTVCLYGPTDPRHTADHTGRTRAVRRLVPCGPCHRERCPLPEPDEHRCMRELDPEEVARAATSLLPSTLRL